MHPQPKPDDHDPFDAIFQEVQRLPAPRPELADSIFEPTRSVLTRRRWFRRMRLVAVCVAFYLGGIFTAGFLPPRGAVQQIAVHDPRPVQDPRIQLNNEKKSIPATAANGGPLITDAPGAPAALDVTGKRPHSDVHHARSKPVAVKPRNSQFESFRAAGDRQLFERGNIRSAMECYQRALACATDHELDIEVDHDSWLLISLKQSRLEARKHVRQKRA